MLLHNFIRTLKEKISPIYWVIIVIFIFIVFGIFILLEPSGYIIITVLLGWPCAIIAISGIFKNFFFSNRKADKILKSVFFILMIPLVIYAFYSLGSTVNNKLVVDNQNAQNILNTYTVTENVVEEPVLEINENDNIFISPEDLKKELENPPSLPFDPSISQNRLNSVFPSRSYNIRNISDILKKIVLIKDKLVNEIKNKIDTESSGPTEILNSNVEYDQYVKEATNIEKMLKEKKDNIDLYNLMINYREKAYNIGKTRALVLLLARDYYEIGLTYARNDYKQDAANSFLRCIEYYIESIQLMQNNETYANDIYDITYKIGHAYNALGDLKYLVNDLRSDSYFMAFAYLDYSCDRNNYSHENIKYYSRYYRGMLAHKLGIITGEERYKLFNIALEDYCISFERAKDRNDRIELQKALANCYYELGVYSNTYGVKEGMLRASQYEQKKNTCLDELKKMMGPIS